MKYFFFLSCSFFSLSGLAETVELKALLRLNICQNVENDGHVTRLCFLESAPAREIQIELEPINEKESSGTWETTRSFSSEDKTITHFAQIKILKVQISHSRFEYHFSVAVGDEENPDQFRHKDLKLYRPQSLPGVFITGPESEFGDSYQTTMNSTLKLTATR